MEINYVEVFKILCKTDPLEWWDGDDNDCLQLSGWYFWLRIYTDVFWLSSEGLAREWADWIELFCLKKNIMVGKFQRSSIYKATSNRKEADLSVGSHAEMTELHPWRVTLTHLHS